MKKSILIAAFSISLIIACKNSTSTSTNQTKDTTVTPTIDTGFEAKFQNLLRPEEPTPPDLDIPLDHIQPCINQYYSYIKTRIGIDTIPASRPRLTMGLGFGGLNLKRWIKDAIDSYSADEIRIEFGVYCDDLLRYEGVANPMADPRYGRLTAFIVAYKTNADGSKSRVGTTGYNLGGLYP